MAKQTFTTGQVLTAAQMTSLQQTAMGGGSTTAKTASYVLVAADAGTVVQMNAAGATTITVNTALFAAGDTVEIQNVGAGVCTVTAGTATVSTSSVLTLQQYDAGSLYFNSTSAAIFFASDAANSPLTTKGDLFTFTTVDARIGVGANDTVLTADSAQATGLKWAAPASSGSTNVAGKNGVINSAMNVWQRGTSVSLAASSSTYSADRWYTPTNANQACTVSRQATGDTTNLPFIQYAMRFQRNSGQTGTGGIYFSQSFESINSAQFAGKTITLSFYARKGADYSATSNALPFYVSSGTGSDQNIGGAGFTGQAVVGTVTATLTTSWQRFSVSGAVSSSATQIGIYGIFTPTGTAGTNDYFELTGVQVEIAASATAYSPNTSTYATELAACQRYYIRYLGTSNNFAFFGNGTNKDTTNAYITVSLPVEMRVKPTSVDTATASDYRLQYGATGFTLTTLALGTVGDGTKTGSLYATVASGLTTSGFVQLLGNNNSTAYVGFSAEL